MHIYIKVSSALAYLHVKKKIVHFDIKPNNVLIFHFPQPGHSSASNYVSSACDSWNANFVQVKLADLGISAYLSSNGFQRKNAAPGYAAPEILNYLGKEHLTEKVNSLFIIIVMHCVHT